MLSITTIWRWPSSKTSVEFHVRRQNSRSKRKMHPPRISQNFSKLQKKRTLSTKTHLPDMRHLEWKKINHPNEPHQTRVFSAAQKPERVELFCFFQGTFNRRLCMYRLLALFATERFGLIKVGMGIRETLVGFAMIPSGDSHSRLDIYPRFGLVLTCII